MLKRLKSFQSGLEVEAHSSSIEYSLQSTSTGVCITCTFLDSSATDCVAVVHQRISQLSSSGLMNIESSHKLNRSGDTASSCIEGVNMEDYQVGVVGGKRLSPTITETKGMHKHVGDKSRFRECGYLRGVPRARTTFDLVAKIQIWIRWR